MICQVVLFAICFAVCFFCSLPFYEGLFYFLYQLCGICIPGLALLCLIRDKSDLFDHEILFAYVFGSCILIAEYIVWIITASRIPVFAISGIIFIVSSFILFRKRDVFKSEPDLSFLIYTVLFLVLACICFFSISYHFIMPDLYGTATYNKDFFFWVGNSISFTKGFPIYNYRQVGDIFYYHYFSNILIAMSSMATGLSVLHVSVYFSYLIPCLLMILGCDYFLRSMLDNRIHVLIGCVFILLTAGSTCFMPDHLYFCPFGFDYGYAFAMICAGHLLRMYRKDDFSLCNVIISCVLIMMDTGFKAPIALVVLMMYGMVTFDLLLKKKWAKGLTLGIVWLLSFVIIYVLVISGIDLGKERKNGLEILGLLGAFDSNRWAIEILGDLINNHGYPDNGITRIVALFLYVFRSNKAAMILLMFSALVLLYLLLKKKKLFVTLALVCTSLWGILLTINTFQDGNSQMYFMMATFPFSVLSGMDAIEKNAKKELQYLLLVLVIALSFSDIRSFFMDSVKTQIDDAQLIRRGEIVHGMEKYQFSNDEYELAEWIKENTGEMDYVAVDCFEYDELRKEEMLGVFSERFIWNDGLYSTDSERERRRQIVDRVFDGDMFAVKELKEENVRYLVQTLSVNPNQRISQAKIVYERDGFIVYSLNNE